MGSLQVTESWRVSSVQKHKNDTVWRMRWAGSVTSLAAAAQACCGQDTRFGGLCGLRSSAVPAGPAATGAAASRASTDGLAGGRRRAATRSGRSRRNHGKGDPDGRGKGGRRRRALRCRRCGLHRPLRIGGSSTGRAFGGRGRRRRARGLGRRGRFRSRAFCSGGSRRRARTLGRRGRGRCGTLRIGWRRFSLRGGRHQDDKRSQCQRSQSHVAPLALTDSAAKRIAGVQPRCWIPPGIPPPAPCAARSGRTAGSRPGWRCRAPA